ncbi:hypothetical protein A2U01_0097500, partial [Trifolium medium]|nr:hypothetical protein [Trifolium medium]
GARWASIISLGEEHLKLPRSSQKPSGS